MKSYKYIARDPSGHKNEGISQADCSGDVLGQLREKGLTPVSVKEVASETKKKRFASRAKTIKSSELAALCWQLTTMIEGGIPITTVLETVAEDIENHRLQEVLRKVTEGIHEGQTFHESISKFPKVFNQIARAMILAGETSGNLPLVLRRLAEYFDNRDKIIKKVKGAMAYPIFTLGFIVLIVVCIMTFIVPRFRMMFDQFGGQLPAFTQAFMGFYDFLRFNIFYLIALLILLPISLVIMNKTKQGHYIFSKLTLRFPLLGKVLGQSFVAIFCRTMSTLLASGVSVLEVFDILSGMSKNDIIRNAITDAKDEIVKGSNISTGIAISEFFPNLVIKMVQVGEKSGSLSVTLDRTSDYYERKVDSTITAMMSLLEPIMIVSVGAVVLVVVLALYLPIFSMGG